MAGLFSTGIVTVCASLAVGQYNDACNKAMDAGTRQVGWRQTADSAEDKTVQYVNSKAQHYAPKPLQDVVAVTGFAVRAARDKRVDFKLPTMGLCNSLSNSITPDSYQLTIQWSMP